MRLGERFESARRLSFLPAKSVKTGSPDTKAPRRYVADRAPSGEVPAGEAMERFKEAARAGYYGGDHVCIIRVVRRPLTGKGE